MYTAIYVIGTIVFFGATIYYFCLPKVGSETPKVYDQNQAGPNEI